MLISISVLTTCIRADEAVNLATPQPPRGDTITGYCIGEVVERRLLPPRYYEVTIYATTATGAERCALEFLAKDARGEYVRHTQRYSDPAATVLLHAATVANFSTISKDERILRRLQADGVIAAGGLTGGPGVATLTPVPAVTVTATATATP